jgi:hypothetical protein
LTTIASRVVEPPASPAAAVPTLSKQQIEINNLNATIAAFEARGVVLEEVIMLTSEEETRIPPANRELYLCQKKLKKLNQRDNFLKQRAVQAEARAKEAKRVQAMLELKMAEIVKLEAKIAELQKTDF